MSTKIKVEKGQNLMDISVQETGRLENIFLIAQANNRSITDDLEAGMMLDIPEGLLENKKVKNYYIKKKIKPGTNG